MIKPSLLQRRGEEREKRSGEERTHQPCDHRSLLHIYKSGGQSVFRHVASKKPNSGFAWLNAARVTSGLFSKCGVMQVLFKSPQSVL